MLIVECLFSGKQLCQIWHGLHLKRVLARLRNFWQQYIRPELLQPQLSGTLLGKKNPKPSSSTQAFASTRFFADDATESAHHGTDVKSVHEGELQIKSDTVNNQCCANNMIMPIL